MIYENTLTERGGEHCGRNRVGVSNDEVCGDISSINF